MFKEILTMVAPYLTGITIGGMLSAVVYGCLKGAFAKTISKINVEKIADKATEKGLSRIKKVTMTHNIQPLIESELEKINEKSAKYIDKALADVNDKLNKIVAIQEAQASYFDESIGVSDDARARLRDAIAEAKEQPKEEVVSEVVEQDDNGTTKIVVDDVTSGIER